MIKRITDRAREPGAVSAGQMAAVPQRGFTWGAVNASQAPGKRCIVQSRPLLGRATEAPRASASSSVGQRQ